jgi:hypothetical protein
MTSRHEITHIEIADLPSGHERVTAIGGLNPNGSRWRLTHEHAIICIEAGVHRFYVKDGEQIVHVIVAISPSGHKYLTTASDGDRICNLLSLCEHPKPLAVSRETDTQ